MAFVAITNLETSAQTPAAPGSPAVGAELPFNCRCIVTLDPKFKSTPDLIEQTQKASGFIAPNTAEGVLVRMDREWLVLKDGSYENWIPTDKVLLLRVSR